MEIKLDTYSLYARALPVYVTIAPVVLALAAILPEGLNLQFGGAAAVVFMPLAYLAGQFGAGFGKRLEKQLWNEWGGPPTTRFLRHENREFNEVTRERIHGFLRSVPLHVPTKQEESDTPEASDKYYEACTEELIRRTRDKARFPLVFKGLTEYGFHRNLLGLKWFGLPLTVLACGMMGWGTFSAWRTDGIPPGVHITATLLSVALALCWLTWARKKMVRVAADRYARYLLEAALNLE